MFDDIGEKSEDIMSDDDESFISPSSSSRLSARSIVRGNSLMIFCPFPLSVQYNTIEVENE